LPSAIAKARADGVALPASAVQSLVAPSGTLGVDAAVLIAK
jgi:hypothetical protein